MACKASPTGQFLSGKRSIATPKQRRKGNGKTLTVRGARENNLETSTSPSRSASWWRLRARRGRARARSSTRSCTRRCGSNWWTRARCRASTTRFEGIEHVHKVVNIDQSPIGRNSRSNPATYIGFYDAIRDLFTRAPLSAERGYKAGRFSFNVKGGRCEECQGEGVITTQLYFMPDVEVTCGACKGARFGSETLEVTLRGKTIDDVLNMSGRRRRDVLRRRAGGGQEDRSAERPGAGVPDAGPVGHDVVRRRSAAHQDRRPS
jgi:excinuclease ABC subunit A